MDVHSPGCLAHAATLLRDAGLTYQQVPRVLAGLVLLRLLDHREAEQEAMAAFEELPWRPVLPASLQWRHLAQLARPQELADALRDLSNIASRPRDDVVDPLASYLHVLSRPLQDLLSIKPQQIREVVQTANELLLDTAGDRRQTLAAFDQMLSTRAGADGVFASPTSIARLMAVVARPRADERIYDPCFGTGNLLLAAWQYAEGVSRQVRRSGSLLDVSGVEINEDAFLVGLTRMLLGGIDAPRLEKGDALERSAMNPVRVGFDLVMADPPWGMKVLTRRQEPWRYQHFPIASPDATGLFIQHALSQLNSDGRAVIAVPEGFLSRGGADRELRRMLVEKGQVEAVIAMPPGVHAPQTLLKSCLLVLSKQGGIARVRMGDAVPFFDKAPSRTPPSLRTEQALQFAKELTRVEVQTSSDVEPSPAQPSQPDPAGVVWEISTEDLAAVDWDLTPRRRESGGLETILADLSAALGEAGQVGLLGEVAQIISGRSINTRDLTDEPPPDRPIPYVRIRDIVQGKITRPATSLSAEIAQTERPFALIAGDVLLSKSGTIGKAAIVTTGGSGAIASSGFYVLRAAQGALDPGYLLAYLSTPACQNWLNARARGAVIQHLSRPVMAALPIPLPPLSMQVRAAAQFREFGTDVLSFLGELTGTRESDRLNSWLAELSSKIPMIVASLETIPSLSLIDPLVELAATAQRWIQREEIASRAARWLQPLTAALVNLRGVAQIPAGPSLLTVLQDAERGFQSTIDSTAGHLPIESQARASAEKLARWMRAVIDDLIQRNKVEVWPRTDHLDAGTFAEFTIELANTGGLPLRALRAETVPDWGSAHAPFLDQNSRLTMHLRGDVPKQAGAMPLLIRWSALDLNSNEVSGTVELALPVIAPAEPASKKLTQLRGSPYVTGDPLGPQHGHEVFFGREQVLAQIARQISTQGNVVLLEGNRRAGKTSILKHLEGIGAIPGWLAVYSNLQGTDGAEHAVGIPTPVVFRSVALDLAKGIAALGIHVPLPDGSQLDPRRLREKTTKLAELKKCRAACLAGISAEFPFADFRDYLEVLLSILTSRGLGLVLMLDEFDKLQEGIDNGVTSRQVPENIRFLIQNNPKFSAILTGSRRLKRLREEYWSALYGLGTTVLVTALDDVSARRVVTEPVKDRLTYSKEAIDRIVEVTARHPFLLQLLCNRIFDYAVQTKVRSITLGTVNDVAVDLVRGNEHFASLWDYAGVGPTTGRLRRQLILYWCAEGFARSLQITFATLHEQLAQAGIVVGDDALGDDLAYLRELELVDLVGALGEGQYRLTIPLMADWIAQQQDANELVSRARIEAEEENA